MLSTEQSNFYEKHYESVLCSGLIGRGQRFLHWCLYLLYKDIAGNKILEVGAGQLEHLKSVKNLSFKEYYATDIRYLDKQLLQQLRHNSVLNKFKRAGNIIVEFQDAQSLKYPDEYFDLLIATCLLAHLQNPEAALVEWKRTIRRDGYLIIYVPCEPGYLLRLLRKLFVEPKHELLGHFNYPLVCAREHRWSLHNLNILIKHHFIDCHISTYTWPIPGLKLWNFNLAYIYKIQVLK